MQSFRTELEQTVSGNKIAVEKDILELGQKIAAFRNGTLNEDKFRALRLARGVYGQRQQGVQMVRIKLPFGKVTPAQLRRIAAVSDRYSNGRLHITTRQDIQVHHVRLDHTPELWAELEKDDVTMREACGNTVRNITAGATAGIDPEEPFDVSPYAEQMFRYFLRKPFGQELGRKIKIAFSTSGKDDALTYIHDFGFIPVLRDDERGFKVMVGGGLGAQPFPAQVAFEYLPAEEIIPFTEAAIRVFDRHGERNSRNKARLKYLIAKNGLDTFLRWIKDEWKAVQFVPEVSAENGVRQPEKTPGHRSPDEVILHVHDPQFVDWVKTNVIRQKQPGFVAAYVTVRLGNITAEQARSLADIADRYAADDMRFTIDQNLLLKYLRPEDLPKVYMALDAIGLAESGAGTIADITACPGTDTCNLGISNSTGTARAIEQLIRQEYPEFLLAHPISIKISGCMNSCGQHGLAHIGFHGSSMKVGKATAPALQVLLGGGKTGNGTGRMAEKVIKIPAKRVEDCVRLILNHYRNHKAQNEDFNTFYDRLGNRCFYDLLKPLTDVESLQPEDFIDWGQDTVFRTSIGVGECAGVIIDLVTTLLFDAEEKLLAANEALIAGNWADAVYHAYASGIHTAKALLIDRKVHCNTHQGIIRSFEEYFAQAPGFSLAENFGDRILRIREQKANERFATGYVSEIAAFLEQAKNQREH